MQTTTSLNGRDRAVLRAVAAGRCEIPAGSPGTLTVDGLSFADQFAGLRLAAAGLIAAGVATIHGANLRVADDARFLVRTVAAIFDEHFEGSGALHSRAV